MPIESPKQPESSRKPVDDSVLSATRIAEALSKMDVNETPSRVLDLLMKKVPAKPPRASVNTPIPVSSNSTLKNSRSKLCELDTAETGTPGSSTLKSSRFSSEYYTPPSINKYDIAKENQSNHLNSVGTKDKINSQKILRDTTNIPFTEVDFKDSKSVEIIQLSSDNEWTDVRPNIACTPDKNATLSSIIESPSYTCSELEFSEDERSEFNNEKRQTDIGIGNFLLFFQRVYSYSFPINSLFRTP